MNANEPGLSVHTSGQQVTNLERDAWGEAFEHSVVAISMVFRLAMEFGYSASVEAQDLLDGGRLFTRLGAVT